MPKTQYRQAGSTTAGSRSQAQPRSRNLSRGSTLHRLRLDSAITEYLADVRARRSTRAADRLEWLFNDFRRFCPKLLVRSIKRRDLISYMAALRDRGLADRTIFNRISTVLSFLRSFGIEGLLSRTELPRYTQKSVDAYSETEVAGLLNSADERSRVFLGFFLGTGCREQEVAYMAWSDVDLDQKIIRITAKPHWGWKPKDCEERCVPIPEWLVDALARLGSSSANSLLFPNQVGQPEGHFLGKLKTLALRVGLNCGHCTNKRGKSCKDKPVCRRWSLHKFRRTFATMHHDSGVSARTLQAWLGHSDLQTTLRYLKVADLRSEKIRSQVDRTFAAAMATIQSD